MVLFLSAQDIHAFEAAISDETGRLLHSAKVAAPPEEFLASLHALLAGWNATLDTLTGVVVVTGPGSFTSTRISVTIANGLAFAKQIPVVGLENTAREPIEHLVEAGAWKEPLAAAPSGYAVPVYDRPPHITARRPV